MTGLKFSAADNTMLLMQSNKKFPSNECDVCLISPDEVMHEGT